MNHKSRYSASNQYRGLEEALTTILEDSDDGLEYDLAIIPPEPSRVYATALIKTIVVWVLRYAKLEPAGTLDNIKLNIAISVSCANGYNIRARSRNVKKSVKKAGAQLNDVFEYAGWRERRSPATVSAGLRAASKGCSPPDHIRTQADGA
ncbi:unnamed protein product [Spodoptera exigua]|nr:unnamed protein product [Spodoptera exigua]